jgi:hypothetical protein
MYRGTHMVSESHVRDRRAGRLCAAFVVACASALGAGSVAAAECYPHCDYNHYYGPYDLSYVRPGLYAYPVCGPHGNCAPYLVYGTRAPPSGNIIVTFPRRPRPVRP